MKSILKNLKTSFDAKYPILRFIFIFATLMGAFYFLFLSPFFTNTLSPIYLRFDAKVSAVILNWLGQNVNVIDTNIVSSRFSISIKRGCDAIEPTALFICAIIAFSAPFWLKIQGIIIGALFLLTLNFIRIISLFFVGIYYPQAFHILHVEIWQLVFILLAMLFFIVWLLWVIRHERGQLNANG
jgi:exosortase/archaeosortase family protein